MPRYFFSTVDGEVDPDTSGTELASAGEARIEAVRYAGAVMEHDPHLLWDGKAFHVQVHDEAGTLLFTITATAEDSGAAA